MESKEIFCENNCGRKVAKEGTCIECWNAIDASKMTEGKTVSLTGSMTIIKRR